MTSELSKVLQNKRIAKGWSIEQAAYELSVSTKTISRWEKGSSLPRHSHSRSLSRVYGICEDEMCGLLSIGESGGYEIQGAEFVKSKLDDDYIALSEILVEMDLRNIDTATEDDTGTPDDRAPIFRKNPDTWRLLTHRGEIVGYWQFYVLDETTFNMVRSGAMKDGEITEDMIIPLGLEGHYFMYFNVAIIEFEHRGVVAMRRIIESIEDVLCKLSDANVFFSEIRANAFTPEGRHLCKGMGLNPVVSNKEEESIAFEILGPGIPSSYFSRNAALSKAYEKEFSFELSRS